MSGSDSKISSMRARIAVLLCCFVCAKAVCNSPSFKPVPRHAWPRTRDEADKIKQQTIDAFQPVVFTKTPADELKLLTEPTVWSPRKVLSEMGETGSLRMKVSDGSHFTYYDSDRAKWWHHNGRHIPPPNFRTSIMSGKDALEMFQKKAANPKKNPVAYLSSRMDGPEGLFSWNPSLAKAVDSKQMGQLVFWDKDPPDQETQVHLWLSTAGVSTNGHFDNVHNAFVQIHGVKRFLLVGPHDSHNIHMFPAGHPNERQSQVSNFSCPDLERFPRFRHAEIFEVLLAPNEVRSVGDQGEGKGELLSCIAVTIPQEKYLKGAS